MHSDRTIIVAIVGVIAAIVVVALLLSRRNKTVALQRRFGKEYERTVTEHGSEREVQAVLEQRQKRLPISTFVSSPYSPIRSRCSSLDSASSADSTTHLSSGAARFPPRYNTT